MKVEIIRDADTITHLLRRGDHPDLPPEVAKDLIQRGIAIPFLESEAREKAVDRTRELRGKK